MVYDIYLRDEELFVDLCNTLRLDRSRYGLANNYEPDMNDPEEEEVFAIYSVSEGELRTVKRQLLDNAGEVKQIRVTGQANSFIWPVNGKPDGLTRLENVLDLI